MIFKQKIIPFEVKTKYDVPKQTKRENYKLLNETKALYGQTVLAGDSITEIFNSYELFYEWSKQNDCAVYNRGISGDTSDRLAERFYDNVLNISPRNIVLLIGTNDIGLSGKAEETVKNVRNILEQIRKTCPETNVILEAVYPVNKNLSAQSRAMVGVRSNDKIGKLNSLLKPLAKEFGCVWLDITDALSDENGNLNKNYCYDGLHLNAKGFEVAAESIIPLLK